MTTEYLPYKHLKHGLVGDLPYTHLKHGQVGDLPHRHLKHGQVVGVSSEPRAWLPRDCTVKVVDVCGHTH